MKDSKAKHYCVERLCNVDAVVCYECYKYMFSSFNHINLKFLKKKFELQMSLINGNIQYENFLHFVKYHIFIKIGT